MAYVNSRIETLLESNRKFAETFQKPPTMVELRAAALKAGGLIICLFHPNPPAFPYECT